MGATLDRMRRGSGEAGALLLRRGRWDDGQLLRRGGEHRERLRGRLDRCALPRQRLRRRLHRSVLRGAHARQCLGGLLGGAVGRAVGGLLARRAGHREHLRGRVAGPRRAAVHRLGPGGPTGCRRAGCCRAGYGGRARSCTRSRGQRGGGPVGPESLRRPGVLEAREVELCETREQILRGGPFLRLGLQGRAQPVGELHGEPLDVELTTLGAQEHQIGAPAAEGIAAGRREGQQRRPGPPVPGLAGVVGADHLGVQVGGRSHHQPGRRQTGLLGGDRDPEVDDHRIEPVAVGIEDREILLGGPPQHDVAGFEIAMDHAGAVDGMQGVAHDQADLAHRLRMQPAVDPHRILERGTRDELGDDEGVGGLELGIEDPHDVVIAHELLRGDLPRQALARPGVVGRSRGAAA